MLGREQEPSIVTLVTGSKSHIHGINLLRSPCKFIFIGHKSITLLQDKHGSEGEKEILLSVLSFAKSFSVVASEQFPQAPASLS